MPKSLAPHTSKSPAGLFFKSNPYYAIIIHVLSVRKKIFLLILGIITSIITVLALLFLLPVNYELVDNPVFEVNSEKRIKDLFSTITSWKLENEEKKLDTSKLGENKEKVVFVNFFGINKTIEASYKVTDTTAPTIEGENELTLYKNDISSLVSHYKISDNSHLDVDAKINGDYDTTVLGKYELKLIATDSSNNTTTKNIILNIIENPEVSKIRKSEYYIKVNREQNVVMVYALDENAEYSKLVKTFVSSTGKVGSETPLGTFTISNKYEALYLVGNVWGHYAIRIQGPYYFHSVPYFTKGNPSWDNLEYLEYNKLGEGASAGCVRLATKDVKWIYENVSAGTTVEIYDSNTLPEGVTKPTAIKIDETSENRGWDPTDPDLKNPWNYN